MLNDNCIHVAHNALTTIGFWPQWPTHRFVLIAAFDFPVPKNEFVNIMRRANDMPIDNLLAIWNDVPARRALLAGQELPVREGALATFEPLVQQNPLYKTDLQLIFYDEPMFGHYEDCVTARSSCSHVIPPFSRTRDILRRCSPGSRPIGARLSGG